MTQPLRFGILGAANIARAFIAGVAASESVVAAAVASRDPAKAEAFARETGVARWHGSYEALLADAEIDAIYIPLPNGLHAEWAIKAVGAGKPVLCEKPLAVTETEAKAMFDAAERAGVPLREAYPYMAQEQTIKLRELIAEKAVGTLKLIRASFGVSLLDTANVRYDPALGAGALLDTGSYAVSLIRLVAGERPTRVQAHAQCDANGVDLTTVATLAYESGLIAQMSCSFETGYHRHALIAGTDGAIETNYLNHPPRSGPSLLQIKRGRDFTATAETFPVPDGNGFRREAESFAAMLRGQPSDWTGASPAESLDIMATLEAIAKAAKTGGWVSVG